MALGIWAQALLGALIGFVPGFLLFEWLASPMGPGLWKLSTPFSRIFLTVSQFLRGKGVLIKLKSGEYEIGTYIPESAEEGPAVQVEGRTVPVDPDNIRWGLFGKKPFGLTWEPGTDLHERAAGTGVAADGGEEKQEINMAAVHRYLEGVNDSAAITRTEQHAKAEYGGGDDRITDKVMAGLIMAMLLLGSGSAYFMLG